MYNIILRYSLRSFSGAVNLNRMGRFLAKNIHNYAKLFYYMLEIDSFVLRWTSKHYYTQKVITNALCSSEI